jgi:hypothetical protein
MLPVAVNVPAAGSYSSALARADVSRHPPTMSTLPLGKSVAVCEFLATVVLPVGVKAPSGTVTREASLPAPLDPAMPPVPPVLA